MIRNVNKNDVRKLSEILGKPLAENEIDYELSMLEEVDGEIFSVFLVGIWREPKELKGFNTEVYFHEILGIYTKDIEDESLDYLFYESKAASDKLVMYWIPWTEENAKLAEPAFVEETYKGMRFLYYITLSNLDSKYTGKNPHRTIEEAIKSCNAITIDEFREMGVRAIKKHYGIKK